MKHLKHLFEKNSIWADKVERETPGFFETLSAIHEPKYLWIGCSDSRVPANEIVGLLPGELFVHRNIANQVIHTDINCLSVIQYAVDNLKIEHIIVCGHYGCGGVRAALENKYHGFIDNWLRNLQEIIRIKRVSLERRKQHNSRLDLLAELNVIRQTLNVGNTTIVQDAWRRKQPLTVHGWIYSLKNGLLKDLDISASSITELNQLELLYFAEG